MAVAANGEFVEFLWLGRAPDLFAFSNPTRSPTDRAPGIRVDQQPQSLSERHQRTVRR